MAKNHRVKIQRLGEGQASNGEPLDEWQLVAEVWSDIRDIGGREFVAAGAERSEVTTRIRIWRRDGIDASMRVLHGARVYNIKAVIEEGARGTLLMCTKGAT
jgi:SPP1 family predicted phage head-tail adaptor